MDEPLTRVERRQMVMDVVQDVFGQLDALMVAGIASWTYTLSGLSDETLLKLWSDCNVPDESA